MLSNFITLFFSGLKNDETKEMLLQQGLDDIALSSTSEQIAYLLVERARLMDELEAEQSQIQIDTPDGAMSAAQIYRLLEQERTDFEQELQVTRLFHLYSNYFSHIQFFPFSSTFKEAC